MSIVEETPERIIEDFAFIEDVQIGYQRYGHGPNYVLGICGGVGK